VTCTGDISDDGVVDKADINLVLAELGQVVPPGTGADLDGDGQVTQQDVLLVGKQIHQPCL
jgi:hypothetical protein